VKLLRPRSLDEALEMMQRSAPVTPIAGGTDLMVSWHHRPHDDLTLLDLSLLRDLSAMKLTAQGLELGALATYWQVMQSVEVCQTFPLLHEAARQVGAVQIQTRGTWAGNIGNGSPAADGVPVMMAYDAVLTLASSRGRREVRLDEFYTGYRRSVRAADELIVSIRLPFRRRAVEWFHKVGARAAQAITKVGVAVVKDDAGWRVVANSVAPTVCRCRAMEAALAAGTRFTSSREVEAVIAQDVSPIDDLRSTAAYRRRVLARLLYHGAGIST
jgi:xanthine dehydrogenase small subunit